MANNRMHPNRHCGFQFRWTGFAERSIRCRSQSPTAVGDPKRSVASRQKVMNANTRCNRWGYVVYGCAVAFAIAGGILRFSGSLEPGMALIDAAIVMALGTGLSLGHLKVW